MKENMNFKIEAIVASVWLVAMTALCGLAPVQRFTSNVQRPLEGRALDLMQDSSQDIFWTFQEPPSTNLNVLVAKDISSATAVTFIWTPADRSWRKSVAGSIANGTNGIVYVGFSGTNLEPNSSTAGNFDYILIVSNATTSLAYVMGTLTIEDNPLSTAGSLWSIDNIIIDWTKYGGYSNTAVAGPYRAGTNISFSANADGSQNVNLGIPLLWSNNALYCQATIITTNTATTNLVVTGTLTPDATGPYTNGVAYGGHAAYVNTNSTYWIWYSGAQWRISDQLGSAVLYVWWKDPASWTVLTGVYHSASPGTHGDATVTASAFPVTTNTSWHQVLYAP